jgi:protein gp37
MGKDTAIGYVSHTFNTHWGCEKPLVQIGGQTVISPECVNCYAEAWDKRCGGKHWGHTAPRRFFGLEHWKEPLKWNKEAERLGEVHRVFAISMGDILEDRRDLDEVRKRLSDCIIETRYLDWLLLTKRPERFDLIPDSVWLLPNVWPGVSAGIQAMADLRIPHLLALKAKHPHLISWVSVEPMLEAMYVQRYLRQSGTRGTCFDIDGQWWHSPGSCKHCTPALDWIVIGGESGPKARSFNVSAGRELMTQCQNAGVPVFWKQFGRRPLQHCDPGVCVPLVFKDPAGSNPDEWPEWAKVQQFPR